MPDKLKMHSLNKVHDNIAKIAALFPNCLTERKNDAGEIEYAIDFDMLRQELSDVVVEGPEQRYQFTWPDKRQSVLLANAPINKTLRPCREESVGKDGTPGGFDSENLYIEGDNLEVLKLLQETYLGKIKMIYIDPPYNTGNDFVYEDDFAQSADEYMANSGQFDDEGNRLVKNLDTNGRFHTDWLNMIYPRLKIAKDLLTEDGVIFISIDDNELHNLRKICDDVFGADNFRGQISRDTGTPTGQGNDKLVSEIDYMLLYSKSDNFFLHGLEFSEEDEKIYNQKDEYGKYLLRPLRKTGGEDRREDRPSMYYPIYSPEGTPVYPVAPVGYESRWRCSKNHYDELVREHRIEWKKENNIWKVYQKFYLEGRTKQASNLWTGIEGNKKATITLKNILEKNVFDFPKPLEVLIKIITIATDKDAYILDFFSGSATTAHAVMQLNAEDGGNRKFIMVQLPEETDEKSEAYKAGYKNICEIGKERIRRAGQKIKDESPLTTQNLDVGFRVLKCDTSNMKDVYYTPGETTQQTFRDTVNNIKDDRTPEDLLFQVMLDLGVTLSSEIKETVIAGKKVFNVADGFLLACFDEDVSEETIAAIAKMKPYYFVMRDSSMANDSVATNFEQLFATYSPDTVRKVL